jgi:hypothetical protein
MGIFPNLLQSNSSLRSRRANPFRRSPPILLSIAFSILFFPSAAQAQSHILIVSGTPPDHKYLSAGVDGDYIDLFRGDDGSGRQRWLIENQPKGYLHILVAGGTPTKRRFLSVNSDGMTVDLFQKDDGSGRQRWLIENQPGGYALIRVAGGTPTDHVYLSVSPDGTKIDLTDMDHGTGRQRWTIDSASPPPPSGQKK